MRKRIISGRKSAVMTGALLLAGLVTGLLSVVPVIDGADYLIQSSTNENQVLIGAFCQLLMVATYIGVPLMLYPILSKHNKGLALGSVAFGIMAGVFIIAGVILLLLLLALSHEFTEAGSPNGSYFQTLGELLRAGRDLVNHVATTLAFVMAMLLFNSLFYRTQIVPRWLSVSGIAGSALSISASLLFMIRFIGLDATYMALNIPIACQQLVLGLWLIIQGYNRGNGNE
ncbi:DUF4386 domain-containing protein [Cohnella soli]|uniref:DUF4386 domain-containing protein n=1 Tax=Cohnella soli TaxID=425005 RepID=A0ABW0HJ43_9BACL